MKKLYKFEWDCGRMGEVDGLFIADDQTVRETVGKDVRFGEILGKHSEIYGTLDEEDLTVITGDHEHITMLEEVFENSTLSGYNPLDYIDEEEEED